MYSHGYELMGLYQQHMERARVLAAYAKAKREGTIHTVHIHTHSLLNENQRVVGEEYDGRCYGRIIELP